MTLLTAAIPLLLLVTVSYIGVCAAVPFKDCRHCAGLGFDLRTDRKGKPKRGKPCRRCKATGKRIRAGRRLFNRCRAVHRDGTR